MKIARIQTENGGVSVASVEPDGFRPLLNDQGKPFGSVIDWIQRPSAISRSSSGLVQQGSAKLLAPIDNPQKIFCIGLNYSDHAKETGSKVGDIPVVFSKFSSAIIATEAPIRVPNISQQVDFEAELVVVIGKRGKSIAREMAREFVFGYLCGNDVSARDWQKGRPGGQWLLGKTFDTFAPLGPWITTADEIAWPPQLDIASHLNGQLMQSSNTCNLIFPIDYLIAHLSQFCELTPGDLIFTGTPDGVGVARSPQVFLRPGDRIEVSIASLGKISNPVEAASESF